MGNCQGTVGVANPWHHPPREHPSQKTSEESRRWRETNRHEKAQAGRRANGEAQRTQETGSTEKARGPAR